MLLRSIYREVVSDTDLRRDDSKVSEPNAPVSQFKVLPQINDRYALTVHPLSTKSPHVLKVVTVGTQSIEAGVTS